MQIWRDSGGEQWKMTKLGVGKKDLWEKLRGLALFNLEREDRNNSIILRDVRLIMWRMVINSSFFDAYNKRKWRYIESQETGNTQHTHELLGEPQIECSSYKRVVRLFLEIFKNIEGLLCQIDWNHQLLKNRTGYLSVLMVQASYCVGKINKQKTSLHV